MFFGCVGVWGWFGFGIMSVFCFVLFRVCELLRFDQRDNQNTTKHTARSRSHSFEASSRYISQSHSCWISQYWFYCGTVFEKEKVVSLTHNGFIAGQQSGNVSCSCDWMPSFSTLACNSIEARRNQQYSYRRKQHKWFVLSPVPLFFSFACCAGACHLLFRDGVLSQT